jgi:hypothetical protein
MSVGQQIEAPDSGRPEVEPPEEVDVDDRLERQMAHFVAVAISSERMLVGDETAEQPPRLRVERKAIARHVGEGMKKHCVKV